METARRKTDKFILLPNALFKLILHVFDCYTIILQLLGERGTVYSCWLGLRATDDLLALKMNCCQRPKAEGNSSSEGPTDHLLPENPDINCFVIPNFLELCSMMNRHGTGTGQNDPLHNTKRNTFFFFFLPLMNHFSRQNTNAIAYKNHWFCLL